MIIHKLYKYMHAYTRTQIDVHCSQRGTLPEVVVHSAEPLLLAIMRACCKEFCSLRSSLVLLYTLGVSSPNRGCSSSRLSDTDSLLERGKSRGRHSEFLIVRNFCCDGAQSCWSGRTCEAHSLGIPPILEWLAWQSARSCVRVCPMNAQHCNLFVHIPVAW